MTPYHGFMLDLLEQVAGGLGLTVDPADVEFVGPAVAHIDPCVDAAPQRGAWMKTETGWVQLDREGGPGA